MLCEGRWFLIAYRHGKGGCITEVGRGSASGGACLLPPSQGQPQPSGTPLPFWHFLVERVLKHSANFLPLNTVQSYMFLMVT